MARGPARIFVNCAHRGADGKRCEHQWHGNEVDAHRAGWQAVARETGARDWFCPLHALKG